MPASDPVYDRDGVQLYHADIFDIFNDLPLLDNVAVLLTDPPYAANKYLRVTEEERRFDPAMDTKWLGNVSAWVGQWFYSIRLRMAKDGVGWVFCNVHYLGFYLRWAKFAQWPLRGIFALPPDEFLLAFGPTSLTSMEGAMVQEACKLNHYGQNKDVLMLDVLLHVSPPGMVFDPFAGQGSSLIAARDAHPRRAAVGVEIRDETVEQAVAALRKGER